MNTHINNVHILGILGKDVTIATFDSGKKKASLSVATTAFYKNFKGEEGSSTVWHNIIAWGDLAEKMAELKKGMKVEFKGSINNRSYKDKQGNTKYITEILCSEFTKLDKTAPLV
jgi:single-strand DNA-binding protein